MTFAKMAAIAAVAGLTVAGLASRSLADGEVLETFPFEDRSGQVRAYQDAQTFDRQCRAKGLATHIGPPIYDGKPAGPGRYEVHANVGSKGRPATTPDPVMHYGEILEVFPFEGRKDQGKAHQQASAFEIECRKYKLATHIAGPLYDGKEAGPGRYEVRLNAAKAPRDWGLVFPWAPVDRKLPRGLQEPSSGPKRHVGHSPFRNLGWQIHAYLEAVKLVEMLKSRGRNGFIAGPFPSRHPGAGWWDVYEDLSRKPEKPDEPATEPAQPEEPQPEKPDQPQPEKPPPQPEADALPAQVYVTVAKVNVFAKPHANSATAVTAARGAALRVLAEEGAWYFVSLPDGKSGWVPKAFTSPTAPQP